MWHDGLWVHTSKQGLQMVFRVGNSERWYTEDTLQEIDVLAEESDCVSLRFWREVLRNDLFGLHDSRVLQEGGATPI